MIVDDATSLGSPAVSTAGVVEKAIGPFYRLIHRARFGHRVMGLVDRVSPNAKTRLQKRLLHSIYDGFYQRNSTPDVTILNYGYVEDGGPTVELRPEDEPNRSCLQLYQRVAGAADLRGKEVLEVGCGRGGGAAFVMRYHGPRSVVGLDFSKAAVAFCNDHHRLPGLSFVAGDAENLPFATDSFDAVVNVESSHTYPSPERFFKEVARALRPGGLLLYADLRNHRHIDALREQVRGAGLDIVEEERITPGVLRSLDLESDRKVARWGTGIPALLRPLIPYFAAAKGSQSYKCFRSGEWEYYRLVMQKPRS